MHQRCFLEWFFCMGYRPSPYKLTILGFSNLDPSLQEELKWRLSFFKDIFSSTTFCKKNMDHDTIFLEQLHLENSIVAKITTMESCIKLKTCLSSTSMLITMLYWRERHLSCLFHRYNRWMSGR